MNAAYAPLRTARSHFLPLRGLRYHLHQWGDTTLVTSQRPPLVMLHGWMDVGASFQFAVDALAAQDGFDRLVIAPDWRGFGRTDPAGADSYWFPDYLGDLDALLDAVAPGASVDLLGHSMGGNVVMIYAGLRPGRVRKLVNLEGFGLPQSTPSEAPARLVQWLDELKAPQALRDYASVQAVAERLRKNNPRLSADKAAWLAPHWSQPTEGGRWQILGDPAHKRVNPLLYQAAEVVECWKRISAPLLWVEGDATDTARWWGERYSKAEFHRRLDVVARTERHVLAGSGHMLHHDQPQALAERLSRFLGP